MRKLLGPALVLWKKNLQARGLTKVEKQWPRLYRRAQKSLGAGGKTLNLGRAVPFVPLCITSNGRLISA